jgi:Zn-dependent M28 family amino/carboxypeptidase
MGSAGDAAARAAIAARFRCLGLEPGGADGGYEQPFVVEGRRAANVVGVLPGSEPSVASQVILVGAHHDHLGDGHLGANDNASGVAALLAVAQAVRRHGAPRRAIVFVTFDGEEAGLLGSAELAAHPPAAAPLDRVVLVVNLDMIGSYAARDVVYAFGTFAGSPARAALARRTPGLHVVLGGHSDRGDQAAFCARGIPYAFFWTPDPRCYHERCDTADRVDTAHLAAIAERAGDLVEALADGATDLAEAKRRHGCGPR